MSWLLLVRVTVANQSSVAQKWPIAKRWHGANHKGQFTPEPIGAAVRAELYLTPEGTNDFAQFWNTFGGRG